MVPIRVTLDGFMSYRDKTTLSFADATLWLLHGRNGAGKSSVFDAIKYALFGTHRGKTGVENLINHGRDSLRVVLDFSVGPDVYRVTRTRKKSRTGSIATVSASRLLDGAEVPIPDTSHEARFDEWRSAVLGLDEKTFSVSTMLQQGRADALLDAAPLDKFKMLAQIVDLSRFEAWHAKADERFKRARDDASKLSAQLETLREVSPDELEELHVGLAQAKSSHRDAQSGLETLKELLPVAKTWAETQAKLQKVAGDADSLRDLLCQADEIEARAERLRQLDAVLDALQAAARNGTRERQLQAAQNRARTEFENAQRALQELEAPLQVARARAAELATELQTLRRQREAALNAQLQLAPRLRELEAWSRAENEIASVSARLSALPQPSVFADVPQRLERAESARRAAPILARLRTLSEDVERCEAERERCAIERAESQSALETARKEQSEVGSVLGVAAENEADARKRQIEAEARLQSASDAKRRFETVEGEAKCGYCGQELSPSHRDFERARLQSALQTEETNLVRATEACRHASQAREDLSREVETCEAATRKAETRERFASEAWRATERDLERAQTQATQARAELSPAWKSVAFESSALASAGEEAAREAAQMPQLQARQADAHRAELNRERDGSRLTELERERDAHAQTLQRAGETPSLQRVAALQQEIETHERAATNAQARAGELEARQKEAEAERDALTQKLNLAREEREKAEREREITLAQERELARTLGEARASVPEAWRDAWDEARENGDASRPQQERDALFALDVAGASQRLQDARHRARELELRARELNDELEKVPPPARRSVAELEREVALLREEAERLGNDEEGAAHGLREAETARDARLNAQTEFEAATRERDLLKTLSDALGRDGLQRKLLIEAERAIVDGANDVLDRLSNGALRLALPTETSGRERALDLVAFDLNSGDGLTSIPVAFLSGSQKFRAAVALAIGIGNAGGGAHRVESVIIDEGFGSLDREGREAMLEELRALGSVLQRVIVVSHQDDFAQGFTHRYHITQREGSSRATREVGANG